METRSSLMLGIRNLRDAESWDRFARIYAPFLNQIVVRSGVPPCDASDVVQDILISFMRTRERFDKLRGRLRAYLRTIARNQVIDWFRRQKHRESPTDSMSWIEADSADIDRLYDAFVLQQAMVAVRGSIHLLTWQCFELHILHQLSAQETALKLSMSVNSVYVNSSRTLAKLREFCANYEGS